MLSHNSAGALGGGVVLAFVAACTSARGHDDGGPTCSSPGGPVIGPADMHCAATDKTATDMASCHPDVAVSDGGGAGGRDGAGGGAADAGDDADLGNCGDPGYGPTMYGSAGSDDDCKYDVSWTSTDVCDSQGVSFAVTVKKRADGLALTGANAQPDVVLDCNHIAPNTASAESPEDPPGTYKVGPVVFDRPGRWVLRFHFYETCVDVPSSPHGHAAFWTDVP